MKRTYRFLLIFTGIMCIISGCNNKEKSLDVEEVYRIGLSRYLLDTLDLAAYDKELSESQMNYIPKGEEDKRTPKKEIH